MPQLKWVIFHNVNIYIDNDLNFINKAKRKIKNVSYYITDVSNKTKLKDTRMKLIKNLIS